MDEKILVEGLLAHHLEIGRTPMATVNGTGTHVHVMGLLAPTDDNRYGLLQIRIIGEHSLKEKVLYGPYNPKLTVQAGLMKIGMLTNFERGSLEFALRAHENSTRQKEHVKYDPIPTTAEYFRHTVSHY